MGQAFLLAGRPMHWPAAEDVKMEVRHRLTTIGVGVHYHAIALRRDSRLLRDIAGKSQQFPEHPRIFCIVEGADVSRRDDQDVGRCLRIEVLEGQHAVAALHDRGRNLAGGNLAKDATGAHNWPSARRIVSQNLPLSFSGGASSISLNVSSTFRCSDVSLVGVQT